MPPLPAPALPPRVRGATRRRAPPVFNGDVLVMLLGQGCPCGWAITISAGLFKNKKETKWFSSRSRVRTRRFGGFSTSSRRSLPLRASPGWGYLHRVRDHSASPLLLLVENGVLITYFPPPSALSRGQWVHGCCLEQTDHRNAPRGGSWLRGRTTSLIPWAAAQVLGLQRDFVPLPSTL